MNASEQSPIILEDTRFARFERIEWWDQSALAHARILVVGAGALGNEVIKDLALLGVGNLVIVDMDEVELNNLSRSVLFRQSDKGRPKAQCAARSAKQIYPDMRVTSLVGNIVADVGLGYFRWAQVILGALDNREARVFVNGVACRLGRPWIDGGIEVLDGIVRGFGPPATACYECTMSSVDWALLNKRRSCSLLERRATLQNGTPTTPTTASIIGGIQTQEAVKLLHGIDTFLGKGFFFDGSGHSSYSISYPINGECPWHEPPCPVEERADMDSNTPVQAIWDLASERLGGLDAIDLGRELVDRLECSSCGHTERVLRPASSLSEDQILCGACGQECAATFVHSIYEGDDLLNMTVRQIGLPAWDIVWPRRGENSLGIEMAGDYPFPHKP